MSTTVKYKVVNGTSYHEDTLDEVINVLERVRASGDRIRIFLGDAKTGKAWFEEWRVTGTIGRSTGTSKIPLLIHNSRSMGGPAISDDCIVAIRSKNMGWRYKHPNFTTGTWEIKTPKDAPKEYPYAVFNDGQNVANFETAQKAGRYVRFMTGVTMSK